MALNAGHLTKVEISSEASANYSDMAGDNSASVSLSRDLIDVTDFGSTHHEQLTALKDSGWTIGGFYDVADAAIVKLMLAYTAGASVWVQVSWDGSTGFNQECKLESFDVESSPDGVPTFSCSIKGTADHDTTIH